MHADDFLNPNVVEHKILSQVNSSKVPTNNDAQPTGINTFDGLMLLGPLGFIVSWTFLFFMLSKIGTVARNEIFVSIKRLHRVPCRNCRFFSNNAYLKCAVNPTMVLTEKAFNCSEYSPANNNLSE